VLKSAQSKSGPVHQQKLGTPSLVGVGCGGGGSVGIGVLVGTGGL